MSDRLPFQHENDPNCETIPIPAVSDDLVVCDFDDNGGLVSISIPTKRRDCKFQVSILSVASGTIKINHGDVYAGCTVFNWETGIPDADVLQGAPELADAFTELQPVRTLSGTRQVYENNAWRDVVPADTIIDRVEIWGGYSPEVKPPYAVRFKAYKVIGDKYYELDTGDEVERPVPTCQRLDEEKANEVADREGFDYPHNVSDPFKINIVEPIAGISRSKDGTLEVAQYTCDDLLDKKTHKGRLPQKLEHEDCRFKVELVDVDGAWKIFVHDGTVYSRQSVGEWYAGFPQASKLLGNSQLNAALNTIVPYKFDRDHASGCITVQTLQDGEWADASGDTDTAIEVWLAINPKDFYDQSVDSNSACSSVMFRLYKVTRDEDGVVSRTPLDPSDRTASFSDGVMSEDLLEWAVKRTSPGYLNTTTDGALDIEKLAEIVAVSDTGFAVVQYSCDDIDEYNSNVSNIIRDRYTERLCHFETSLTQGQNVLGEVVTKLHVGRGVVYTQDKSYTWQSNTLTNSNLYDGSGEGESLNSMVESIVPFRFTEAGAVQVLQGTPESSAFGAPSTDTVISLDVWVSFNPVDAFLRDIGQDLADSEARLPHPITFGLYRRIAKPDGTVEEEVLSSGDYISSTAALQTKDQLLHLLSVKAYSSSTSAGKPIPIKHVASIVAAGLNPGNLPFAQQVACDPANAREIMEDDLQPRFGVKLAYTPAVEGLSAASDEVVRRMDLPSGDVEAYIQEGSLLAGGTRYTWQSGFPTTATQTIGGTEFKSAALSLVPYRYADGSYEKITDTGIDAEWVPCEEGDDLYIETWVCYAPHKLDTSDGPIVFRFYKVSYSADGGLVREPLSATDTNANLLNMDSCEPPLKDDIDWFIARTDPSDTPASLEEGLVIDVQHIANIRAGRDDGTPIVTQLTDFDADLIGPVKAVLDKYPGTTTDRDETPISIQGVPVTTAPGRFELKPCIAATGGNVEFYMEAGCAFYNGKIYKWFGDYVSDFDIPPDSVGSIWLVFAPVDNVSDPNTFFSLRYFAAGTYPSASDFVSGVVKKLANVHGISELTGGETECTTLRVDTVSRDDYYHTRDVAQLDIQVGDSSVQISKIIMLADGAMRVGSLGPTALTGNTAYINLTVNTNIPVTTPPVAGSIVSYSVAVESAEISPAEYFTLNASPLVSPTNIDNTYKVTLARLDKYTIGGVEYWAVTEQYFFGTINVGSFSAGILATGPDNSVLVTDSSGNLTWVGPPDPHQALIADASGNIIWGWPRIAQPT